MSTNRLITSSCGEQTERSRDNAARRGLPGFLSLCVLLASFALFAALAHAQTIPTAVIELASVDVTKVTRQTIANEVRIAGSLMPIRRSTLTSRVSSTILELPVQIGDVVKAGQLLVKFDTEALASAVTARKAEIDALDAQIELAESVLERNANLMERRAGVEATLLEARANLLNLRAQLRSKQTELGDAERTLSYGELRAEFDGIVATRSVDQGQTVSLNTELMTIVDLSRMEVDAGVPTSRIALVRLNQPVVLSVEGFAGRAFHGEVVRMSPTAVAGSRAVRVFVAINNEDGLLRGGMFTTGRLKVDEQKDVFALPMVSVRHDAQGTFVLKVNKGVLQRQPVTVSTTWLDRGLVQVSGIDQGDVIVTAPLPKLMAGTSVRVEGA